MRGSGMRTDEDASQMRILCVTEDLPWPATSGYRVRLSNILPALTALATVDHWVALKVDRDPELPDQAPDSDVARVRVVPNRYPRAQLARIARWGTGSLPRDILQRDWKRARADFEQWVEPPYDLVWFGHLETLLGVGGIIDAPAILDLDNLWDHALGFRRQAFRAWRPDAHFLRQLRGVAASVADAVDAHKYRSLHRTVARQVGAVLVSSELDLRRVGVDNAVVVPNAYPAPTPPAGLRDPDLSSPCLVMTGSLRYMPNADAARWFVHEVLPTLRAALPGVTLRLVGSHGGVLDDLATVAGVELVGSVDDIGSELRRADAAIVPIRFGGGTRVKILEAFAYRLPVVSTTVGCEGIGAVSGTHLLVADSAESFAAACVRAVRDPGLRSSLTGAAWDLYRSRYEPAVVRATITDVVKQVVSASAGG